MRTRNQVCIPELLFGDGVTMINGLICFILIQKQANVWALFHQNNSLMNKIRVV
jgi:hypothetical protein